MKSVFVALSILIPSMLFAQKTKRINKYSIGIEMNIGHSFPNFDIEQEHWKATFYPAGALNVMFVNRINQHWITDLGIGITGYALANKGSVDNYVLDFASPTISSGISYNFLNNEGQEHFIKLTSGFQLGYQGEFVEKFETYTVKVESKNAIYPFIRPEIGFRKNLKQRMKGSRYSLAYEFGTFFRFNLNTLGTAQINETGFQVIIEPRGNIIGGYFKILFPSGKKTIKMKKQRPTILPTKIKNTRYL